MLSTVMRKLRHCLPFVPLLLVAGILAYHSTTTRGYVTSQGDQPIAGADVLLADSTRVVAHTTTDAAGYFRFVHPPLERERHQMLLCAPGHSAMRSSPAASAIFRSSYGLEAVAENFFWTPDRIGWTLPVPPSCPRGEGGRRDSGPFSSFTPSEYGGPMQPAYAFDSIPFFLMILLVYAFPLLLLAWLVRTFSHMRQDQVRMLQLVSSIKAELRRRDPGCR